MTTSPFTIGDVTDPDRFVSSHTDSYGIIGIETWGIEGFLVDDLKGIDAMKRYHLKSLLQYGTVRRGI